MLKVTVEIVPAGNFSRARVLGTALIGNIGGGEIADYDVQLSGQDLDGVRHTVLENFPRFSMSVWDLVLRSICKALMLKERLPKRPRPLSKIVPVRTSKTGEYIRISDIPMPARVLFQKNISHSTCPLIEEERDPFGCAFAWDFHSWLAGGR
jgi:hypothetical protein